MEQEKKILFNGEYLTEQEFETKRKTLQEQKGVEVVKVTTEEYKIRFKD